MLIDGTVTAINDDFTVDVLLQGTTYSSVPTKVLMGSQASIYEVPVLNSACLVKFRDGNRGLPQIDSFDQVDKLLINCQSLVEFNGGDKGGIPLSPNVSQRLNNIENFINTFIPIYNNHTHILALTSGTGTAAITVSQETGTLIPTKPSDIENTKITQ